MRCPLVPVRSIAIGYVDPEHWIVGGRSLAVQGKRSVYFAIKATDETNTKQEKEQYIREIVVPTKSAGN